LGERQVLARRFVARRPMMGRKPPSDTIDPVSVVYGAFNAMASDMRGHVTLGRERPYFRYAHDTSAA
jgi:hypothetical protein